MTDRILPQSQDAERGLLASFLLAPLPVGALCAEKRVTASHFHAPAHAEIFSNLTSMWTDNSPIDFITLTQRLRDRSVLDACGGAAFVTELFTFLPTAANSTYYLEIVEDKRILREIIKSCHENSTRAYEATIEVRALLDSLLAQVAAIAAPASNRTMTLRRALTDKLDRMQNGEPASAYVWTGLSKLDRESPMRLGDMPLISGERKSGKSILALSISRYVAREVGPVIYFSLEDPIAKLTDRLVAAESAIPMARDRMEDLNEDDMQRLTRAIGVLKNIPLIIRDDCYDLTAIMAVARQQKAQMPDLKLIVVDYGQLVRVTVAKGANREQEMAAASRGLRLLSMELSVAVIVLVQLNKEGDTRESKAWEQDCTAMWKLVTLPEDDAERNAIRILTVPFQRNGESGIGFRVAFLGHIARIETAAEEPR